MSDILPSFVSGGVRVSCSHDVPFRPGLPVLDYNSLWCVTLLSGVRVWSIVKKTFL